MLDHPDFSRFELESLRTGVMAGSPCPVEVPRRQACASTAAKGDE
jgi:fatty-acyl-CoA synthase